MEIKMKDYKLETFQKKDWYSFSEIVDGIRKLEFENEQLRDEKKSIEQEYEDFKKEVEDNYRPLTYKEQLGSW